LEALPLTPNGKLDRRALPEPAGDRPALDTTLVAAQTPAEHILARIWTQVLGLEQVGVHDNFFELGGDSILSIQVVARAAAAGLSLTPRQLFQQQTIAQLAAVAGSAATVQPPQAEQELVGGPVPLTPIQHWFFEQSLPQPQHWNQAIMLEARQQLDSALLCQAVQALLLHHDTLRLRAHQQPDGWQLFHATPDEQVPFTQVNLTTVPEEEQGLALEAAATTLQASLDLTGGPLLRVALFELGLSQPARLLLVIHHLAIDIVSWPILLADLQTAYRQLSQGQPVLLPPKTTSYRSGPGSCMSMLSRQPSPPNWTTGLLSPGRRFVLCPWIILKQMQSILKPRPDG
jgi:fengycin family lipopeptide synthetase B